VLLCENIIVTM